MEEWRPVRGFEDRFEVSNHGRVCRLSRTGRDGRKWPARILSCKPSKNGYVYVNVDGMPKRVHRWVCEAFNGTAPFSESVVRHLDGNPSNNTPGNLAWGTPSENAFDRVSHGTHPWASKKTCPRGHELVGWNNALVSGRNRKCRACHRAVSWGRYYGLNLRDKEVLEYADEQFRRLSESVRHVDV